MEVNMIVLAILIISLAVVFTVDTVQKRRRYLLENK
jgi:hypothetical protein